MSSLKKLIVFVFVILALGAISILILFFPSLRSSWKTVDHKQLKRSYLLHLPYVVNPTRKIPLVISLHGYGDSPRLMETYTGLSRLADKKDFIVVYPQGTFNLKNKKLSWNALFCCGNGYDNQIDDVDYIRSLVKSLQDQYPIDTTKIYVVGFSNGAMMAQYLAIKLPDVISKIAIVSGSVGGNLYGREILFYPKPPKAQDLLAIHGKLDETTKYEGGKSKDSLAEFTSFHLLKNFWVESNECEANHQVMQSETYIKESYLKCKDGKTAEFYTLTNVSHVWPGGIADYKNLLLDKSFPATDEIIKFFGL